MPDPSAFDRGAMLTHLANSKGKGGIVPPSPNYKGRSVEIRPPKWVKRIWIGKLETLERAQYVADAVYHYLGMPPFHFAEGVMTLPAITCIGTVIGTPVELSTQEMRVSYVNKIAKGQDFELQRDDFILKVKNVVHNPDFPFLAPPPTEMLVLDDDDRDGEDDFVFDEYAAKALQMSGSSGVPVAVVQTHVAGPDSVIGSAAVQAYVPSFGFNSNDSEYSLQSADQSFNAHGWRKDDFPITSFDEKPWIEFIEELNEWTAGGASTPSVACDDGGVCRDGYETSPILDIPPIVRPYADEKPWIEFIEELNEWTAGGASTPSVACDDGGVCRDGYETSPILDIPPIVRPYASTSSKNLGNPVERAVPARSALDSSSDSPSPQFAMNTKRRRIGD